jgi:hypothetical protein
VDFIEFHTAHVAVKFAFLGRIIQNVFNICFQDMALSIQELKLTNAPFVGDHTHKKVTLNFT